MLAEGEPSDLMESYGHESLEDVFLHLCLQSDGADTTQLSSGSFPSIRDASAQKIRNRKKNLTMIKELIDSKDEEDPPIITINEEDTPLLSGGPSTQRLIHILDSHLI